MTRLRVTHAAHRDRPCQDREHGTVSSSVPEEETYDGTPHPGWIGVRWDSSREMRHPGVNLLPCSC